MIRRTALAVAAALAAVAVPAAPAAAAAPPGPDKGQQRVIVQLRPGADRAATTERARTRGGHVRFRYTGALRGFAGTLPTEAVDALRRDPDVLSVTPDSMLSVSGEQTSPPWGLDRVDQRAPALDGRYTWGTDGTGVTVYVLDTGIRTTHADFGGRASSGADYVDGTHGVAKNARLVAVRVLDCDGNGPASSVIAGLDWVLANRNGPAVVNMSLGGDPDPAVDQAVARVTAAGVTVVAAAGNDGADACTVTPARVPSAVTVGAAYTLSLGTLLNADLRAFFSNHGRCVDLFAPGLDVRSAWATSDAATSSSSGTSMAAPHVAGAAARFLQAHPAATPARVAAVLRRGATPGVLDARSGNDKMLYAGTLR